MGLSPSCRQLTRVTQALLGCWRRCKVKDVSWDATNYIDDMMPMIEGTFAGALELSLRLMVEFIILGYSVNWNEKSTIVPTRYYCHIGVVLSSAKLRFTLPGSRVRKLLKILNQVYAQAEIGGLVRAKIVAKLLGRLYSAAIVLGRAVAIMTRGITQTLAKMLGVPVATFYTDLATLRCILKRIWGGYVIWTVAAQQDLCFWLQVEFAALWAPFSHDRMAQDVKAWVANPLSGRVADDVRVFAVDTSNVASGGGEFLRDGSLWRMQSNMIVRLTDDEVEESSTLRELRGADRLDIAVIPAECKKAVVVVDSQASEQALLHGSKVKAIMRVVRSIYLRQLKHNRVLWPVWVRRSHEIISKFCDVKSRVRDSHAFVTAPAIFYRANAIARKLWGRGFQLDVCADMHNVQPVDCRDRLPFFSQWLSPWTSAVDMFQADWRHTVNWCNPPFALIPRVLALLRAQKAVAAVLLPLGSRAWWQRQVGRGAPGVLQRFTFNPNKPEFRSAGLPPASRPYSNRYAVVFFDFSPFPPKKQFVATPSVESLANSKGEGGATRYRRLHWASSSSTPTFSVCQA